MAFVELLYSYGGILIALITLVIALYEQTRSPIEQEERKTSDDDNNS